MIFELICTHILNNDKIEEYEAVTIAEALKNNSRRCELIFNASAIANYEVKP